MKSVSGKDLARLLEKHGWELKRIKGSHHIYAKSGNPARISLPIHGTQALKTGLDTCSNFQAWTKLNCRQA